MLESSNGEIEKTLCSGWDI